MSQIIWLTVSEIELDTGTEYLSDQRVRRTRPSPLETIIYDGKVEAWGTFEWDIPTPAGLPRISEGSIEIADPFREWRNLLSNQTARRRIIRANLLAENTSLASSVVIFTGEIIEEIFPPGRVRFNFRDFQFSWLDEPFPALAIKELYPDLAPEDIGGFIPIIVGRVRSVEFDMSPSTCNGVIPLPHIGMVGSPSFDRWAVACHPVFDVVAVYRRETVQINIDVDADEWVVVDPSEYVITETDFTAGENPFGFGAFTVTNLDFYDQQPKGTEIRIDCDGIDRRGEWGPLPAIGFSTPELLRNPIDAFINITYTILAKAGVSVDIWDTTEIAALRERFETGFDSPPVIPLCDWAITQSMTAREILGQFVASFNLDMFVNREGKGTLRFISETDPDRPVFKEGKHILRESFSERKPTYIANQTQLRFLFNNATGQFESPTDAIIDNTTEQQALALDGVNKIERDVFDLYCVRDYATAIYIQTLRNDFMSLGSYRQEFHMPAPPVLEHMELANLIGITHSMGLQSPDGYTNVEAKITGLSLNLDGLEYTVSTILRVPVEIGPANGGRPEFSVIYDDTVNPVRSSGGNPSNSIDNDAPVGESATYCSITLTHPNSIAQYVHNHLYGFPEPRSGFTSATLHILIDYTPGSGDFPFPIIYAGVFVPYTTAAYGEAPFVANEVLNIINGHDGSTVLPLTELTYSMSAAAFAGFFPGGASDIHMRIELYQGIIADFTVACVLKIYDVWISYEYS